VLLDVVVVGGFGLVVLGVALVVGGFVVVLVVGGGGVVAGGATVAGGAVVAVADVENWGAGPSPVFLDGLAEHAKPKAATTSTPAKNESRLVFAPITSAG
jgi:hypothetical protein